MPRLPLVLGNGSSKMEVLGMPENSLAFRFGKANKKVKEAVPKTRSKPFQWFFGKSKWPHPAKPKFLTGLTGQ